MSECVEVLDVSGRENSSVEELGDAGLKGGRGFGGNGGMSIERVLSMRVVCWAGVGCFTAVEFGDVVGKVLAFGTGSKTGYTRRSTMLLLPGFSI